MSEFEILNDEDIEVIREDDKSTELLLLEIAYQLRRIADKLVSD